MSNDERLLRAILRLLIVLARWQFDSPTQDYRTRKTWDAMRHGIDMAEKELEP